MIFVKKHSVGVFSVRFGFWFSVRLCFLGQSLRISLKCTVILRQPIHHKHIEHRFLRYWHGREEPLAKQDRNELDETQLCNEVADANETARARPNTRLKLAAVSHLRGRSVASLGQFQWLLEFLSCFSKEKLLSCGKMLISRKKKKRAQTQTTLRRIKRKKIV